jgi:hypothetical protein
MNWMVKLGISYLDRFFNDVFLNKRLIGRPIKYNIRNKGKLGRIELVYNPQNGFERQVTKAVKYSPYLAFVTYRFHVERARDAGLRFEDICMNKFFKEPFIQYHIYTQNFHPITLLERVRYFNFYWRPRGFFKGFRVPDWANC